MNKLSKELEDLLSTFKSLRNPENGCAWDREQTFKSIASCAIEEAYDCLLYTSPSPRDS